jgi:hypothetical protein
MVDDAGRIRPAYLSVWSKAVIPPKGQQICSVVLQGAHTVTLPLRATTAENPKARWFLKVSSLSSREHSVAVELVGTDGRAVAVPGGPAVWPAGLANSYLGPTPATDLAAVRIRTTDEESNLCIGSVEIGLPQVSE